MRDPSEPPTSHNPHAGPPGVRGPWLVAVTLSLFVVVPSLVLGIWFFLLRDAGPTPDHIDTPLVWSEREDWPRGMFTTFKSLERGMMSAARTNETYKDLGFHVEPAHHAATLRCAVLARQPREAFAGEATREALQQEVAELPELFYAHFLLGLWHQLRHDAAAADAAFALAFDHAPAALMRRYMLPSGGVAAGREAPTLVIAADQIVDDQLDRSLELVYPFLTTDARGFVYLPTYKAILRQGDTSLPPGVTLAEQKPRWFTFFGNVGRLPDATLP